jgi:chromosome segregation ATPase
VFIEDVRSRRSELEQDISALEEQVVELQAKQTNAQEAVSSLSKTAAMYENQREELRRIQRRIDVRQIELEDLRADIEFEVSEQVAQRMVDILALRPRARKRAIEAALINPRSSSTTSQTKD